MATTEELVVRAKPEGLDETSRGFQQMEEDLDDAERQMEDTTGGLGDLAGKWKAALGAIVAGVAVAVGGLLTQVPIVGQLVGGLSSIVQGLAFQLDKKLRPVLQPLATDLYELGNAVAAGDWDKAKNIFSDWAKSLANFDWSGTLNDIVTGFGDLVNKVGTRLGEMDLRQAIQDLRNKISQVVNQVEWGKTFNDIVGGLWNFLKGTDWVGIAKDGITWLAGGLKTWIEQTDWSKLFSNILDAITSIDWVGTGKDIVTFLIDGIASFTEWAIGGAADVGAWIYRESGLKGMVDGAAQWGKDMINGFINGLKDAKDDLVAGVKKWVVKPVDNLMPHSPAKKGPLSDLDETGPGLVDTFATGIESNMGVAQSAANDLAGGAEPGEGEFVASIGRPQVIMDGRDVTDEESRYRADELSRLGRNG